MSDQDSAQTPIDSDGAITSVQLPEDVMEEVKQIGLPPDAERKLIKTISKTTTFRGPLPPSEEFAKYESVLPGSAERMLACMELEQKHRHDMNKIGIDLTYISERRGQDYAFIIMILLVLGAIICAYLDKEVIGGLMLAAASLGAVKKFIDGRVIHKTAQDESE